MSDLFSQLQQVLGMGGSSAPQAGIGSLTPNTAAPAEQPELADLPRSWEQYPTNTLPQQYVPTPANPNAPDALNMKMWAAPGRPQDRDPKTGLETMPKTMDTSQAYAIARGMGATKHLGTAQLPPEHLAGMLLQEGRPDLGNNVGGRRAKNPDYYDQTNQKQGTMFNNLKSAGLDNSTSSWLTRATAKQDLANRLKIPFGVAWNGTGTSAYGQSGAQYAQELQKNIQAAQHPRNAQMLNLIRQGYQDGLANPVNPKVAAAQ